MRWRCAMPFWPASRKPRSRTTRRSNAGLRPLWSSGAGPPGSSLRGALHEFVHLVLRRDFPKLDMNAVRICLVEAAPFVLGAFSPSLRDVAARVLRRKGVELVLDAPVAAVREREVELSDGRVIAAGMVIWAAGVKPSPLAGMLGVDLTRTGKVPVEPTMQVSGHPEVFVVGDIAETLHRDVALPPLAGVALQEGRAVARNIAARLQGRPLKPFRYFDRGTMATIGRNQAVVDIRGLHVSGFIGWVTWLAVHLVLLITFRSRILVLISWAYDYLFYDRPVRLIVRAEREPRVDA
jgi:NADH:ubiquinone reductase (H+-translocating)